VVNLERHNIRTVTPGELGETPTLAVIDASFISLSLVIPPVLALLAPQGKVVALIKPQFEVGKGKVGKGGVVRDPLLHVEVVERLRLQAENWQVEVKGVIESPLLGPKGNKEFLLYLQKR
jgi:23S rRNA (cytidine1920-2'-O)/16S rRNA (cytidine1409-2'-O)-methyltransferase